MKKSSTVAVIIPAWQAWDFMDRCLESIKHQTQKPSSVMIGVDGCEKTLEAAIKAVEKHIGGIGKVYWFSKQGPYLIRNTLAKLSRSEILLFFDADDEMCGDYVRDMSEIAGKGNCARARQQIYRNGQRDYNEEARFGVEQGCGIRREFFLRMGGYPPWLCKADTAFMQLCKAKGLQKQTTARPVLIRNKHSNCLTERPDTGYHSALRRQNTELIEFLLKNPADHIFESSKCERVL